MIAVLPPMISDATGFFAFVVAASAALAILWKTPPVKWLRARVSESFGLWMRGQVQEANAEHHEYVRYHLGPNGTTKPIHQRLCDLERAAGTVDEDAP